MLTKVKLLNELEKINIGGKPVIVHTSLKAIGEIDGGAETLLCALIEHFTKDGGLLCIPTHTWDKCVLDFNNPYSCIGALPNAAARSSKGIRSLHPTHSICVFGDRAKAEELVKEDAFTDSPMHPNSSYGKLFRDKGYILLIGVGQEKNTYIHCVEEMLEIPNRLTEERITAKIIHKNNTVKERRLRWFDPVIPDVSVNFGKFEEAFRHFGCIEDYKIGNAGAQLCSAVKIKAALEIIYRNAQGKELLKDKLPLDKTLFGGEINE